jgi:hypothetical protein
MNEAGHGDGDQLVIDAAGDARLDRQGAFAVAYVDVGGRFAGQVVVCATQRVVGAGGDDLIDVGAEGQALVLAAAAAFPVHLHGHPGRVLHLDAAALDRGFEPVGALGVALEHAAEQAHELLPADRTAAVEPGAVALDEEGHVAAVGRHAAGGVAPAFVPPTFVPPAFADCPGFVHAPTFADGRAARPWGRLRRRHWQGLAHEMVSAPAGNGVLQPHVPHIGWRGVPL